MKELIPKREQCRNFVKSEDWKSAFKLAKGFDALFTKEELGKIDISYECLVGRESFYRMLKYDVDTILAEAKEILLNYVKKSESDI